MKYLTRSPWQLLLLSFLIALTGCDGNLPMGAVSDVEFETGPLSSGSSTDMQPWANPGSALPVANFDASEGELPEGIAIDRQGRIYVSLSPLGEIWRIDSGGLDVEVTSFDLNEGDNGVLGLTFDRRGHLYAVVVSSNDNIHGVWRIALDGSRERLLGTENIDFPNDITFDARGNTYISDSNEGAIWRMPRQGMAELWTQDATLEGTGAFGLPIDIGANGLAFVPGKKPPAPQHATQNTSGGLLVANTEKGLLAYVPIGPDGSAGTPQIIVEDVDALFGLDGITIDATGHIYGAVNAQDKIVRVSPDGSSISTVADAGFDFPASLTFGTNRSQHTLFITNYAILKALTGQPDPEPGVVKLPVGPPGRGHR